MSAIHLMIEHSIRLNSSVGDLVVEKFSIQNYCKITLNSKILARTSCDI